MRPHPAFVILLAALGACNGDEDDTGPCVEDAFLDADGDGFGDPDTPACSEDPDAVDNDDDCDDADASIHPGADEVPYDGIDQDCDGEDLTDVDDDGYDAEATGGDDCDDTDPDIHPGADEVPYDGVDQDCDGEDLVDVDDDGYDAEAAGGEDCDDLDPDIHPEAPDDDGDGVDDDCDGMIDETLPAGAAVAAMGPPDARAGTTLLAGQDVDGAGGSDLLVGAPRAGVEAMDGGCLYLLDPDGLLAPAWCGTTEGQEVGTALAGGADLDGVGLPDVAAGGTGGVAEGAVEVLAAPLVYDAAPVARILASPGDGVGEAVAVVPGEPGDLLAGAHLRDEGVGEAWLFRGPLAGDLTRADADLVVQGPAPYTYLGRALLGKADLDGDGIPELVVGGYGDDTAGADAGAVWVLWGTTWTGVTGVLEAAAADVVLTGRAAGHRTGQVLAAAGDVDGDGMDDLLVAAPGHDAPVQDAGVVFLVPGAGLTGGSWPIHDVASLVIGGVEIGQSIGTSLAGGHDLDGGGVPDLVVGSVVGAPAEDERGGAWLFLGEGLPGFSPATITVIAADRFTEGPEVAGKAAWSLATGDADGDGVPDLSIGAPETGDGGAVWLLAGPLLVP